MQRGRLGAKRLMAAIFLGLVLTVLGAAPAPAQEVKRITKDELKGKLASPNLTIIDVRAKNDWAGSAKKIKGAVREDPGAVDAWAKKYPSAREIVLYCA